MNRPPKAALFDIDGTLVDSNDGTVAIHDGPWDLLARLEESPLVKA